jgi:hypothetical protein
MDRLAAEAIEERRPGRVGLARPERAGTQRIDDEKDDVHGGHSAAAVVALVPATTAAVSRRA